MCVSNISRSIRSVFDNKCKFLESNNESILGYYLTLLALPFQASITLLKMNFKYFLQLCLFILSFYVYVKPIQCLQNGSLRRPAEY